MAKKKIFSESAAFDGIAQDMRLTPKADRDVRQELLDQNYKENTIDTFEKRIGIKPKQAYSKDDFQLKNKLFKLDYAADRELLNKLMNDPKYKIVKWSEAWGGQGEFYAFVIYSENLSMKEKDTPQTDE